MGDYMKTKLYCVFNIKNFIFLFLVSVLTFAVIFSMNIYSVSVVNDDVFVASKCVIIDAGHGGEDGGTQSADGALEKDINLSISLKIDEILKSLGIPTVLIRDGDYMIYDSNSSTIRQKKVSDIHNRKKYMDENKNSLFLSIHQNYFTESKYSGAQVFYSKNDDLSPVIAQSIQDSIRNNLQPQNERKIKPCGTEIYLLYHATVPTVMVECGFLSNAKETEELLTDDYQKKIAFSIVQGILSYL